MEKQRFRLSTKAKYAYIYTACAVFCIWNILLVDDYSLILSVIFAMLYGVASCIMVGNFWKPCIAFGGINTIGALLIQWYTFDQNGPIILIAFIVSLLFSYITWMVIKKVRPDFWQTPTKPTEALPSVQESLPWKKRNSAGLTIILVSNLCYLILFVINAVFFEFQSVLTIFLIVVFPLAGLILGIVSYTKTKRFAGICGIFLGASVSVAITPGVLFVFINEYLIVYAFGIALFAFFGYLMGILAGLLAKFADSAR